MEADKVQAAPDDAMGSMLERLREVRQKEKAYEAMLYALRLLESMAVTTQACNGQIEASLVEAIARKALIHAEPEPF